MKAINLIPSDQRRGAGGAAGRTGGISYAVVGVLALALIMFAAWTHTNTNIKEKASEASSLEQTAAIRTAQASALGPYAKFAELRSNRVQTIKKLADSRFDWAHAMGELSRTLPADTWLTAMTGTVAPGVGGGGGASDPLRTARAVPALELSGCSTSQTAVTTFLARLKLMNGVDRVDLSSSKKSGDVGVIGEAGPTDSASGSTGTVRDNPCAKPGRPAFSVVVFYEGLINPPGKTGKPTLNKQAPVTPAAPGQAAPAATTPATATPTATTTTSQTAPAVPGAAK